jgi:hypothetical protein
MRRGNSLTGLTAHREGADRFGQVYATGSRLTQQQVVAAVRDPARGTGTSLTG